MNNKDLSIIIDDVKLNIRVGAIIKYQNKILVEKNTNVDFTVIPGGRVKTLENSPTSILREIKEETGLDLSNENIKMISLIENFFSFNNQKYHELFFVYKIDLEKDYNLQNKFINLDDKNSYYYLLNQEEFQKTNILPNILKEISNLNEFKHYIVNNLNQIK